MNLEKIKNILRSKDIPFEKNHKKDDCLFIPYESDDYIIIHSRYLPFIKKDNPIFAWAGTPLCEKKGATNTKEAIRTVISKIYSKSINEKL